MDRQYKARNYLKHVTFNLLHMSRGNWKWFRLETILNNIDMKKASWVNYVISLDRQYKPRNYLKNVTFTLLNSLTTIDARVRQKLIDINFTIDARGRQRNQRVKSRRIEGYEGAISILTVAAVSICSWKKLITCKLRSARVFLEVLLG